MLIPRRRIAARVAQLGRQIAGDLAAEPLAVAAVMTGSIIFVADLIRRLPVVMRIHLLGISSYPGPATASRGPVLLQSPEGFSGYDFGGHNVLLVDDVLDSGRTLQAAGELFRRAGARRVRTCVLLAKPARRRAADGLERADYTGFEIPDEFVVGYGLDYNDYFRNLADVAVLKASAMRPRETPASTAAEHRSDE